MTATPKDLAGLLALHPSLRLAHADDNRRILEFFERAPMRTSAFELRYLRRPDFFRLLRFQSDRAYVVLDQDVKDGQGGIRGVGTISLRPGWADGVATTVGYLGDLRITGGRSASRIWRAFFADLMTHSTRIAEFADCTRWFTAILDGNREARAALRPRPGQPALVPIGPFTMRNLIMRLPFSGRHRATRSWTVAAASPKDEGRLSEFFEEENRHVPLGFRGEMARRISRWEGLSIGDFVHASDAQGLAACLAPWSPAPAKQTEVSRVPFALRLVGMAAKAFPRPPLRIPGPGERLRALYLTHMTFARRLGPRERADAFRAMLDFLFDRWRGADWHCVSFCDFREWDLGRALGGYLQETVPITVYAIVPPDITEAFASGTPAFEMAMV